MILRLFASFRVTAALFILVNAAYASDTPTRYLVKFEPQVNAIGGRSRLESQGLNVRDYIPEIGVYVADPRNPAEFESEGLRKLRESRDVAYIEPNHIWRADAVPNDELYPQQDGMIRLGIEEAWKTTVGSYDTIVAVVDTGTAHEHPDLVNQLWVNSREIAGNGIDDDGNGFIDDLHGWDFANKDNDPADDHEHGTHVAGTIGAEGGNGKGIVGVNWRVRIMSLKFLDKTGSGETADGIQAILYAVKNGARVINCSWGSGGESEALQDAIRFAYSQGALIIAAAGNESKDADKTPHFPAAYPLPGVVSVASSDAAGTMSSFSNWGAASVDLAAPGSNILATLPDGKWGWMSGTSMATPMVAGIAALILSKHPSLSALELRNALMNAAIPQASYQGKLATGGEMSAPRALEQFTAGFQVWPSRIALKAGQPFQLTAYAAAGGVTWSVSDTRVATIDPSGTVTGHAGGTVNVTALDSAGQVAAASTIQIVGAAPPFGSCAPNPAGASATPWETGGAALSMSLPFAAGLLSRRQRRRRPEPA